MEEGQKLKHGRLFQTQISLHGGISAIIVIIISQVGLEKAIENIWNTILLIAVWVVCNVGTYWYFNPKLSKIEETPSKQSQQTNLRPLVYVGGNSDLKEGSKIEGVDFITKGNLKAKKSTIKK